MEGLYLAPYCVASKEFGEKKCCSLPLLYDFSALVPTNRVSASRIRPSFPYLIGWCQPHKYVTPTISVIYDGSEDSMTDYLSSTHEKEMDAVFTSAVEKYVTLPFAVRHLPKFRGKCRNSPTYRHQASVSSRSVSTARCSLRD